MIFNVLNLGGRLCGIRTLGFMLVAKISVGWQNEPKSIATNHISIDLMVFFFCECL